MKVDGKNQNTQFDLFYFPLFYKIWIVNIKMGLLKSGMEDSSLSFSYIFTALMYCVSNTILYLALVLLHTIFTTYISFFISCFPF